MKKLQKNKKYKFITGWIDFGMPSNKHNKENIVVYISHVYLRRKDTPNIWGKKQKITLKVKK